jgi:hypothetical protein
MKFQIFGLILWIRLSNLKCNKRVGDLGIFVLFPQEPFQLQHQILIQGSTASGAREYRYRIS